VPRPAPAPSPATAPRVLLADLDCAAPALCAALPPVVALVGTVRGAIFLGLPRFFGGGLSEFVHEGDDGVYEEVDEEEKGVEDLAKDSLRRRFPVARGAGPLPLVGLSTASKGAPAGFGFTAPEFDAYFLNEVITRFAVLPVYLEAKWERRTSSPLPLRSASEPLRLSSSPPSAIRYRSTNIGTQDGYLTPGVQPG
jgi:hypothetical protein